MHVYLQTFVSGNEKAMEIMRVAIRLALVNFYGSFDAILRRDRAAVKWHRA